MDPGLAERRPQSCASCRISSCASARPARVELGAGLPAGAAATTALAGLSNIQGHCGRTKRCSRSRLGCRSPSTANSAADVAYRLDARRAGPRQDARSPQLTPIVPMFTGLIERADGMDGAPAALLTICSSTGTGGAAAGHRSSRDRSRWPAPSPSVRRAPSRAGGDALATRYEITVAPSANLWRLWRAERRAPTATADAGIRRPGSRVGSYAQRRASATRR